MGNFGTAVRKNDIIKVIIPPTRTMVVQLIPYSKSNMYLPKAHVKREGHLAGRVPVASVPCILPDMLPSTIHIYMHVFKYIHMIYTYIWHRCWLYVDLSTSGSEVHR